MSNTTSKIDVVVSPEQLSSIDAEQEKNGASRLLTDYWVVCVLCQGQAACSFFHSGQGQIVPSTIYTRVLANCRLHFLLCQ